MLMMVASSVLPPPPRYSGGGPYHPTGITGVVPLIETNNTLTFPAGEEWQFLVGEGTYVLKEDLHLATPPPHPSESAIPNTNPLSTAPQPATAGTKISLVSLSDKTPPNLYKDPASPVLPADGTSATFQEASSVPRPSNDGGLTSGDSRATSNSDAPTSSTQTRSTPAFGEGNAMLAPAPSKDANRRRKPKNNVTKSNSSFISRVILHDNLSRKLADRPADGMFAFCNINRAFEWLDLSSPTKDYLTKFLFTKAHCLCHDVNKVTKSASNFDVISGFSTGEIIWWEPFSQRYTRMNKNGTVNSTPVAEIRWIPGSENLFLAGHMDGTLIVYDKEREDAPFLPEGEATSANSSDAGDVPDMTYAGARIQISKSVHSRNQKTNPVAVWKLSNHRINAFAFSPDHRHLAAVSEDGTLRIMDYLREELLDIFYAYYGGLTCVCWTPDGKYVLTGGQDDLISIWSLADSALVARCEGHQSWVSALAFDPWRCDERNYRFGSVGEDGRLCLWDFGVGMLHRPKNSTRQRGSISTSYSNAPRDDSMSPQGRRKRSESGMDGEDGATGIFHPVEPRARVPMLPPVLASFAPER